MAVKLKTVETIQASRAFAAILVTLFHLQIEYARAGRVDLHSLETYLFRFGAVGVHIFFVISGFIMVFTNRRMETFSLRSFAWRRFARIFPIYWMLCLVQLIAFHYSEHPKALSWADIGGALLLWPKNAPAIIGVAWTLPYEIYFYICFGLAITLFRDAGLKVLAGLFLLSIAAGAAHHFVNKEALIVTSPLLLEFILGGMIGRLTLQGRLPERLGLPLIAVAAGLFAAGLMLGYERGPSVLVWGIPSAILILGLVSWEAAHGTKRVVKHIGRLGDSSYVLYLIHPVIITIALTTHFFARVQWLGTVTGSVLVTLFCIALAHLVHVKVETPMLAWLKPRTGDRADPLTRTSA